MSFSRTGGRSGLGISGNIADKSIAIAFPVFDVAAGAQVLGSFIDVGQQKLTPLQQVKRRPQRFLLRSERTDRNLALDEFFKIRRQDDAHLKVSAIIIALIETLHQLCFGTIQCSGGA
jgi:hypothetical protein